MHIDWTSLAEVGVVAAAAALGVVLLVAFGTVGLSTARKRQIEGPDGDHASGTDPRVGLAVAVLCVFAAGLIVCYGLYLIIA
jgi:hypothetical protein